VYTWIRILRYFHLSACWTDVRAQLQQCNNNNNYDAYIHNNIIIKTRTRRRYVTQARSIMTMIYNRFGCFPLARARYLTRLGPITFYNIIELETWPFAPPPSAGATRRILRSVCILELHCYNMSTNIFILFFFFFLY
jgi:hypothetical protein